MKDKSRESLSADGSTSEGSTARYANYFQVGHNAFEVVVEFGQHYEGSGEPQMHTRIVVAPVYAKALLGLLATAVEDYEKTFGELG